MKKKFRWLIAAITSVLLVNGFSASAQPSPVERSLLFKKYDLSPDRTKDTQFFTLESRLLLYRPDGKREPWDVYRFDLRCVPGTAGDEYTCLRFTVQSGNTKEVSIPFLTNWKYIFKLTPNGKDEKGQLFGIDHSCFEKLTDSNGRAIPIEKSFHVYNAFIDFHSMNVFADKTDSGKGVQDLVSIGDRIVHVASFSEPAVSLGDQAPEGSVFRNGEITLEFKGIGLINKKSCAILQYDSGESSFVMLLKPFPNMEVNTIGSSHYWGDIYKDLQSGWIQKAVLHEIVVSETTVTGQTNKIHSVIERHINIQNTGKK